MLTITINKDKTFEYKEENGAKNLNGIPLDADIQQIGAQQYHVLYEGKSYTIELLDNDKNKKMKWRINGKVAEVDIKGPYDGLLAQMELSASSPARIVEIKAPMPGLLIDIKVKEGEHVKEGDSLLVLEAMKMENIIKAPCGGIVQSILAQKGDIVEKNKVLIKFQ